MANGGRDETIIKSILELRSKKKRPDHESVVSHAQQVYGLKVEDGRACLCNLLNRGQVVNTPSQAGHVSLFVKDKDTRDYDVVPEGPEGDDRFNDSFLCFLDTVKTPTKTQKNQEKLALKGESNNFLEIINKLIDQNSKLYETNEQMSKEIMELKFELGKCSYSTQSKHLNSPLSEENLSIPKSPVDKAEYKTETKETTRETTKQSLESQWRMVQRKKHEEFSYLKALEKKKKNDNTSEHRPQNLPNKRRTKTLATNSEYKGAPMNNSNSAKLSIVTEDIYTPYAQSILDKRKKVNNIQKVKRNKQNTSA